MKAIFFDLDGTLLPMDYDTFEKGYFSLVVKKLVPLGISKESAVQGVWAGTKAMVENDGRITNAQAFWKVFDGLFANRGSLHGLFDEFYDNEFDGARQFCGTNPHIAKIIGLLKSRGLTLVVATNPIFPKTATFKRIRWAGLDPDDFAYVSTYENSHFCKPNPEYYKEILEKLNLNPSDVIMVGNDTKEDAAALESGIPVFIVSDCLVDKDGNGLSRFPHGGWNDFCDWIESRI